MWTYIKGNKEFCCYFNVIGTRTKFVLATMFHSLEKNSEMLSIVNNGQSSSPYELLPICVSSFTSNYG